MHSLLLDHVQKLVSLTSMSLVHLFQNSWAWRTLENRTSQPVSFFSYLLPLARADKLVAGALIPMTNNGIPTMSMGYLLPESPANDKPVVWRGLMVQKAVHQLLFDVDWRRRTSNVEQDDRLDVLVLDMPPGTGDVQLTLGQLVEVDGVSILTIYGLCVNSSSRCHHHLNTPRCCFAGCQKGCPYVQESWCSGMCKNYYGQTSL